MSNLTRWEPAREMVTLREAMDRLFDEAFTWLFSLNGESGSNWASPAIGLYQTDNDVVVKPALPGIKADEVQINISGDILTINGEVKQEEEKKERSWYIREQRSGAFERSIRFPTDVIADRAKAHFENGIHRVHPLEDGLHLSVLRLISEVVGASHEAGKWTATCIELSPNLAGIPGIKSILRDLSMESVRGASRKGFVVSGLYRSPWPVREFGCTRTSLVVFFEKLLFLFLM